MAIGVSYFALIALLALGMWISGAPLEHIG
jgi:hypothetical protein